MTPLPISCVRFFNKTSIGRKEKMETKRQIFLAHFVVKKLGNARHFHLFLLCSKGIIKIEPKHQPPQVPHTQ
jgi:hypothetical protein